MFTKVKNVVRFENAELLRACVEEAGTFALLKRWRKVVSEGEALTDPLNIWLYLYR